MCGRLRPAKMIAIVVRLFRFPVGLAPAFQSVRARKKGMPMELWFPSMLLADDREVRKDCCRTGPEPPLGSAVGGETARRRNDCALPEYFSRETST